MKLKPYGYSLPSDLYLVVYSEHFDWLQCDHGDGSIAVDVFDANGKFYDGIVACPDCLKRAEDFLNNLDLS